MLIALLVACASALVLGGLWLLARRDAWEARAEAKDATERVLLALSKASSVTAGCSAALDAQHAAEAQVRVAHYENIALRRSLAMADADREALAVRIRELEADTTDPFEASITKLRLYGVGSGVRNRDDD